MRNYTLWSHLCPSVLSIRCWRLAIPTLIMPVVYQSFISILFKNVARSQDAIDENIVIDIL